MSGKLTVAATRTPTVSALERVGIGREHAKQIVATGTFGNRSLPTIPPFFPGRRQ